MNRTHFPEICSAVVGAGFIGPVHVEALTRNGVRVKGICGIHPQEGKDAAARLGLQVGYATFEDVLADPEIQVVHLATPNVLHYSMSKAALLAGKHVMCEKPLALTTEETSELKALAAEKGLHAAVCYNIRYYPLNQEVKARIAEGKLGKIMAITGSYVQDWLMYDTDYNWRVLAEQGGALRAIADIGTHWMDLIWHITGLEVESIFADLFTVHPIRRRPIGEVKTFSGEAQGEVQLESIPVNTDDGGSILFRFKNGAKGQLWVSQITAGRKNSLKYEISGSEGSAAWDSEEPNSIFFGHRPRPNEVMIKDPSQLTRAAAPFANYPGGHAEGFPDAFKQCFRTFYQAIAAGAPTGEVKYPTFAEGHHSVAMCEAIMKSHKEQRWITV
jgi:predicted dehydrogenase